MAAIWANATQETRVRGALTRKQEAATRELDAWPTGAAREQRTGRARGKQRSQGRAILASRRIGELSTEASSD